MSVYLDNAATTALHPEVLEAMIPYLIEHYGNPSSQHGIGREARSAVETARKQIAGTIQAHPGEIVFTSGGTEANNMILKGAVRDLGIRHIVTSPTEHHGVLHTIEYLVKSENIRLTILKVNSLGQIDLEELEEVLKNSPEKTLVSLMHANNETGAMTDLERTANICKSYHALFHSDTVQTFAHYRFDVQKTPVDFLTAAAHKFHGPKGVGMLYMSKSVKVQGMIHGGGQERGLRAGTENVAGIVGMAKAIELAYTNFEKDKAYILSLKNYLIQKIQTVIPDVEFNGTVEEDRSLYTVLSLSLPPHSSGSLLLFQLDMQKIYVSGGSACSSGASAGSHVLDAMGKSAQRLPLRASFSIFNTREDIDKLVVALQKLYNNSES